LRPRKVQARKEGDADVLNAQLLVVQRQQNAKGKVDAIVAVAHQMHMKLVINISMADLICHEQYFGSPVFSKHVRTDN
jgi:hypothetical protein